MLTQTLRKYSNTIMILLPLFSIIAPFTIIYFYQDIAYPPYPIMYSPPESPKYTNTFEVTWKGRTFYLFFLWLFILEIMLGWEELRAIRFKLKSIRTFAIIVALLLPTIYVVIANFYGLNKTIVDLAYQKGMRGSDGLPPPNWMPLSTEYLVFTVLFALIVLVEYGISGLMNYSISITFLGIIGLIYTIDNLYPNGQFTPFQFLVFPTATLAASFLNLMGYQTSLSVIMDPIWGWLPKLTAQDPGNPLKSATFGIGWPCAGIESLLIFTVTILLFMKKSAIPTKQRIIYFVIGAAVTFFINILRIATIFIIGVNGGDWEAFHNFYGQLYSITWIILYPLIIIGSRVLWSKIRSWKAPANNDVGFSHQTKLSN